MTQLAIGEYHSCVTTMDGTVHCWGSNDTGQLGVRRLSEANRPVRVPAIKEVAELRVGRGEPRSGAGSTCVRLLNNELWCWRVLVGSDSPQKVNLTVQ